MFERVLVGYDGRPGAADAVALARTLADGAGCPLTVARVLPERSSSEAELLDELATVASAADAEARSVEATAPADGLSELAAEIGADLVVVGSSHRGSVGRVFPGSTALRLLEAGPFAVAVAPHGFRDGDRRLLVLGLAIDGYPETNAALRCAIDLGERLGATMRVVTVVRPDQHAAVSPPGTREQVRDWHEARLAEAMAAIPASIRPAGRVEHGDPARVIVEEAERGVDLLVLGSRGFGPTRRLLSGSVSARVIEDAPCPVLVVPGRPEQDAD